MAAMKNDPASVNAYLAKQAQLTAPRSRTCSAGLNSAWIRALDSASRQDPELQRNAQAH